MKTKVLSILVVVFCILCSYSCEKNTGSIDLDSNVLTFNLDTFEQRILNIFTAAPIGWAYAINQNGQLARSGAFGFARTDEDGELAFSIDKKLNIASLTKTLTAIAALQLIERRGLSVNSKIAGFLPDDWETDDGVSELTFGELLGHRSGLQSQNNNFSATLCFSCLKQVVATGVVNPNKEYQYLNANFALFRILIPSMWKGLPGAPNITLDDQGTQDTYIRYMQDFVFTPSGVGNANCTPEDPSIATLYYNFDDDISDFNGVPYGDWTAICGGGGYFLSTVEMAAVLAFLEHSTSLLSTEANKSMKENRLGYNLKSETFEINGSYYGKGGAISTTCCNQGVKGEIAIFPIGVEIVIMMNSQGQGYTTNNSLLASIYQSYNTSFVGN